MRQRTRSSTASAARSLAQMQGLSGAGEGGGEGLAKAARARSQAAMPRRPAMPTRCAAASNRTSFGAASERGLTTVVKIRCTPSGDVLSASVSRSSGNSGWDQAVVSAIHASVPLPPDSNGRTRRTLRLPSRRRSEKNCAYTPGVAVGRNESGILLSLPLRSDQTIREARSMSLMTKLGFRALVASCLITAGSAANAQSTC